MVEYKANWNDKLVIKVGRFYPSSKTCSCGHINKELTLHDRIWTCDICHTTHERDILAANNILKEGLKIKSLGTSDNTGGATIRLRTRKSNKHVSMKPEAHQSLVGG